MNDRHHHFRLWTLGTLVIMVTLGTLAGVLLRQWQEGPDGGPSGNVVVFVAGLLLLRLIWVWFRNGHKLWVAAKTR